MSVDGPWPGPVDNSAPPCTAWMDMRPRAALLLGALLIGVACLGPLLPRPQVQTCPPPPRRFDFPAGEWSPGLANRLVICFIRRHLQGLLDRSLTCVVLTFLDTLPRHIADRCKMCVQFHCASFRIFVAVVCRVALMDYACCWCPWSTPTLCSAVSPSPIFEMRILGDVSCQISKKVFLFLCLLLYNFKSHNKQ